MTPLASGRKTSGTTPSPGFSRFPLRNPQDRAQVFVAIVTLLVLLLYAMLLPAGKWAGDEYVTSWVIATRGWHSVVDRVMGWSPRPFSEMVTWLYLSASNDAGRQLITPFLAMLWAGSLAAIAFAGRVARVPHPVLIACLIFVLSLMLATPGEMFYWPQGAATYLPCWAGLAAATVLHRADLDRHRFALAVALMMAALSAEIGALTVLIYTAVASVALMSERKLRQVTSLFLPALCGLAVCLLALHGRVEPALEVADRASGLAGNWSASMRAAIPFFARETASIEGLPIAAVIALKVLLLLCLPPGSVDSRRQTVAWAVSLLLGAFASVVLAYHQFGTMCCQRHVTLRQAMVLLALFALAGLLNPGWLAVRRTALALLLLGLLGYRVPALVTDLRTMPEVISLRQRNWAAANAQGDSMTQVSPPPGAITNTYPIPPGRYVRTADVLTSDTPWYAWGIMMRFGKHVLTVTTP